MQGFDPSVTEHGGHRPSVQQFHALFEHVVQIFRHARHLLGIGLHRDHGHFDGALPQRFAGTVDRRVSAADDGDPGAKSHFRCTHADVAQERKSVKHAVLILTLGSYAVGLGEAYSQHARVVVLFQTVPSDVLSNLDVGLDGHPELDEPLDLAIEHVLREHPVGNAAAIESARFGRFFKDRHFVAQAGQLVGGAVASGTGPDDGNFLTVWLAGLDYVACQGLSEIAKKPLDRTNRDGFIVLAPVAGLLARMVAHSAGN